MLLLVLVVATSIWVGGYVTIAVVARTASRTLDSASRVAFFRDLGRGYFWVGTPALLVALIAAAVLARDVEHGGLYVTAVVVAAVLVVAFAIAVVQARRMTRLRMRLADDPALAEQVRRGAVAAGALRGLLGVLSLVLVVLGCFLAT